MTGGVAPCRATGFGGREPYAWMVQAGWWLSAGLVLNRISWHHTYVLTLPLVYGAFCAVPAVRFGELSAGQKGIVVGWWCLMIAQVLSYGVPQVFGLAATQMWGVLLFVLLSMWAFSDTTGHRPRRGFSAAWHFFGT